MSNGTTTPITRRTNTTETLLDPYDHAISLLDSTLPHTNHVDSSRSNSPNKLAKRTTVTSVRERLAQRKYAKWQQERFPSQNQRTAAVDDTIQPESPLLQTGTPPMVDTGDGDGPTGTETTDFAPQPETVDRGRKPLPHTKKKPKHKTKEEHYEVDILYENQRGLFFFGIPLYSHSSLLNFDPAPWVTKDLKDSAVNITNAQVPDPSWEWAWKSWYVDMSHDVDEEGWQYSFSFGRKWVWHGTHPWFHSYVRRRRWLRKRVKCHHAAVRDGEGSMHAAHALTGEYFTIHPKRDRSPPSPSGTTAGGSYTSQHIAFNDPPDSIDNIGALITALRLATIDREKIDSVKKFLKEGGEELAFLEDQIPEIMSMFVFQTSRRQLLELLQREAAQAQEHRDEHDAEHRPEGVVESRRIDNLLRAMRIANDQIGGLEYWSDRKQVLQFSEQSGSPIKSEHHHITFDGASTALTGDDPIEEVKGISKKAELDVNPTHSVIHPNSDQAKAVGIGTKGKGKAKEAPEDEKNGGYKNFNVGILSDRMGTDSLLVSDEETEVK